LTLTGFDAFSQVPLPETHEALENASKITLNKLLKPMRLENRADETASSVHTP
jgi:hypothetical protein